VEHDTMNRNENDNRTHTDLIASNRVEGTVVYDRSGERLGTISHFMVGKRDGKVNYAVLEFGGFFGVGTDEYTLPWEKLEYDTSRGGYVVDVTKEQLECAPRYSKDQSDNYDRSYYEDVSGYYGSSAPTWY
jgi:sporulation protein YlmC with PRC-barrel domain